MTNLRGPHIRKVALIGGECSGKSTLALALASELPAELVVEQLRLFVDAHGRPPTQAEQAAVMQSQIAAEDAAMRTASEVGKRWVVGDPSALMTAVYSVAYFGDESLIPAALEHQSDYCLTVWCDIDLPWQADGSQRDGPNERTRVHNVITGLVSRFDIDVLRVSGSVEDRLSAVKAALAI